MQGTPTEAWLNKLVTNDAFIDRLMANNAFIDKLASRIITLQNGGMIKSENYDGIVDDEKWYEAHLTNHGWYCLNPRGTYTINVDDMFLESEYEPHYLGEFENSYAAERSTDTLHLGDWYYDTTYKAYFHFHIYDNGYIMPRGIREPQKISGEATQGFKIDTQGNADFMNDVRIGNNLDITGNTEITGNLFIGGINGISLQRDGKVFIGNNCIISGKLNTEKGICFKHSLHLVRSTQLNKIFNSISPCLDIGEKMFCFGDIWVCAENDISNAAEPVVYPTFMYVTKIDDETLKFVNSDNWSMFVRYQSVKPNYYFQTCNIIW